MRIVSPFHDFYDSAMAQGNDPTSLFVRKTQVVDVPVGFGSSSNVAETWDHPYKPWLKRILTMPMRPRGNAQRWADSMFLAPGFVLFAGQVFPFLRAVGPGCILTMGRVQQDVMWSLSDVEAWMRVYRFHFDERRTYYDRVNEKERVEQWFAASGQDATSAMVSVGQPIAVMENPHHPWMKSGPRSLTLLLNPKLVDYGFARQMDPWTAYQKLSMFVEGVMRHPEVRSDVLTDQEKIQQHGFTAWSFKKLPGGKMHT